MAGPYKRLPPLDERLSRLGLKVDLTLPKSTKRKRKPGAGAPPKFQPEQQAWLRERYRHDLKADPLLAKHDAAVPHVQELARTEFGLKAGRNTLLEQIIRPVLGS